MTKQVGKKFVWLIQNFSSLQSEKFIYSDPVLIGGYKWRLCAYPKGNQVADHFSLFLQVVDYKSLPSVWRRFVKYRLTIVPQPGKTLVQRKSHRWFDKMGFNWGYGLMIPLTKLQNKDEGFLVNGELTIVAEVDVLEVVGTVDASGKSIESSSPMKKRKLNNAEASSVNWIQVLPSQN
ncbi:MATH domain and coiled-coil domain-containing protein At3g58410-like [Capsella rubella]|uniref:MATH domain and coiled-coil domain-containing protein At3g58410-like n=1 Tax=Capsella rubella TaxID=81985 RepID=UPI000CD50FC9|nr:MATH domain and coiled-coil domain-containing protein At3g58410-like [Capsella rubella]